MHILALLQQAQVQRAAEEALDSLDERSMQAEAASEEQQQWALQVSLDARGLAFKEGRSLHNQQLHQMRQSCAWLLLLLGL